MSRTFIIFRIQGFEADDAPPDDIASHFKEPPTKKWLKGDPVTSSKGHVYKHKHEHHGLAWEVQIDHEDACEEARHLFGKVKDDLKALQTLHGSRWPNIRDWSYQLALAVYCEDGRAPALTFDREFIYALRDVHAELDIDVYPMHPILRPKVGVTAMVTFMQHMLVGVRQGSHGADELSFPGGHQEWMDTWEDTAVGEVAQEVAEAPGSTKGLRVHHLAHGDEPYLFVTDNRMEEDGKHYTTVWAHCSLSDHAQFDPSVPLPGLEPNKCPEWRWMRLHDVLVRLLGREDYDWDDILNQNPRQAHWLPAAALLRHHRQLGLAWPVHLSYPDGWAK